MAGFPAPFPTNNPYAGEAAGYASAAASVYNGLQSALNQKAQMLQRQKEQQQASAQQSLKDQMEAYNQGAVDVPLPQQDPSGQNVQPGRPTLQKPYPTDTPVEPGGTTSSVSPAGAPPSATPSSYSMDPKRIVNVGGKQMYFPTASEKEAEKEQAGLNDSNSFVPQGQLADMLQQAGVKKGARIKASDSHSLLQAINEAQPKDEPFEIDTSGKFQGPDGKPVSVVIGKKSGTVRMLDLSGGGNQQPQRPQQTQQTQQPQTPGASAGGPFSLPEGWTQAAGAQPSQNSTTPASGAESPIKGDRQGVKFAPQEKAEKPDISQIIPGQQGPNGGMLIYDKNSQSVKEVPLPTGSKPVMTAAQTEADKDRHVTQARLAEDTATRLSAQDQARADKAAKGVEAVKSKHEDFQSKEQDQWYLKGQYDRLTDPTQTPDGTAVTLPSYNPKTGEVKDGSTVVMNKDLRTSLTGLSAQAQRKALEHQKAAAGIRKSMGWGEFAQAPTPVAPTGIPAQQTAQPTVGTRRSTGQALSATGSDSSAPIVNKSTNAAADRVSAPATPAAAPLSAAKQPTAQPARKTASLGNIRAYAQKNKITEAEAIRKAKTEGYSIAGQ